LVSCVLT